MQALLLYIEGKIIILYVFFCVLLMSIAMIIHQLSMYLKKLNLGTIRLSCVDFSLEAIHLLTINKTR